MNLSIPNSGSSSEELFRFSGLVKRPVLLGGKRIGRLIDLVIVDKDVVAEVTHICVGRPYGRPKLFVPWQKIEKLTTDAVVIENIADERALEDEPSGAVLLMDYIMDKKVIDVEDREVEVVYDVTLTFKENRLFVVGVDLTKRSMLRRLGLTWLVKLTESVTDSIGNDTVEWNLVEPLPENLGSFEGDLRLKVVKEELAKMPPVDVARILEVLTHDQRVALFAGLETESASDTLEELEPVAQRSLIASMPPEKAAKLIDEMTPGQAADVLAVLPWSEMNEILSLIDKETGTKVREILETREGLIANYVVTDYVKLTPENTVLEARQAYRNAKEIDAIAYLYIVDSENKLLGFIESEELLRASDETPLREIMNDAVLALEIDKTLKDAEEMFERYEFRAIPVVDQDGKMQGIVPYRDVMDLKHLYME